MGFKKNNKINIGRVPWNKGKPWSKLVKMKIGFANKKPQVKKRIVTDRLKKIWIKNLYKNGVSPWLGRKLTKAHRKKLRERQLGSKSPVWKGGRSRETGTGYIKVYRPEHPHANGIYVFEHRLIVEKALGRYLSSDEFVHHKNGKKDDNRLENLEIMTRRIHHGRVKCPYCQKDFLIR